MFSCQYHESYIIAYITSLFFRNIFKKFLDILGKQSPQENIELTIFKYREIGSYIFLS